MHFYSSCLQLPPWFPGALADRSALGVWSKRKKDVDVVIRCAKGRGYIGPARLTSGTEIRSGKAVKGLKCGERIRVTISA